jgi:hypothetical protein
MTGRDRERQSERVAVQAYAAIQVFGLRPNDQAFGTVINVSAGGILVLTPQAPPIGQTAIVRAAAAEELFAMEARVVRVDRIGQNRFEVALEFTAREREQHRFLKAFGVSV